MSPCSIPKIFNRYFVCLTFCTFAINMERHTVITTTGCSGGKEGRTRASQMAGDYYLLLMDKKLQVSKSLSFPIITNLLKSRWLDRVTEATNMNLTQLREAVEDRRAWRALVHGVTKSRTRLNN